MKIFPLLSLPLFIGISLAPLAAQDDSVVALSRVAERYVNAYNEKDLDAVLALFTPEAEMIDEIDALAASGLDEIRDIFESSFTQFPDRRIALEVISVRQVAENVVVEEGTASFSGEVPNEEGDSVAYSAVLVNDPSKGWLIASSRELKTDTPEMDPLAEILPLEGEWVMHGDQLRMELSLALSPSGRFLTGTALVTTPAEGTMETDVRIGFDPALGQIRWWTFDELGGFSEGIWQEIEGGWLIRTNGVTADGETTSAIQELTFSDKDTYVWNSKRRFLAGEAQPDLDLHFERRPPSPSLSFETAGKETETTPDSSSDTAPAKTAPGSSTAPTPSSSKP